MKVIKHSLSMIIFSLLVCFCIPLGFVFADALSADAKAAEAITDNVSLAAKANTDESVTVKALAIRVGFSDEPLGEISSEAAFSTSDIREYFEVSDTGKFPYESISAYYKRSSYGRFNIHLGEIIDVQLPGTRDSYDCKSGSEDEYRLIKEIVDRSKIKEKLPLYDNDGDGAADFVYFFCNGKKDEKGSVWWPHCHNEGDDTFTKAGLKLGDYVLSCKETSNVLIHETAHFFGIPDYYSYEDYYTYDFNVPDMMNDNQGDHNGLSKLLAGWIGEDEITFVNKESAGKNEVDVCLAPIDSQKPGKARIALIAPEITGAYGEFFLAEYISGNGNMSLFDGRRDYPEGFRIIHVFYDETKGLFFANALTKDHTTGADFGVFEEGDEITPYTVPSTSFIRDGSPSVFTGIKITDFVTGDSPHFKVSFTDDEKKNTPVVFEQSDESVTNMLELTLNADRPLKLSDKTGTTTNARLEREGVLYPLVIKGDEYNATKFYLEYRQLKTPLLPDTDYTLILPSGAFIDDDGNESREIRMNITTGSFTKLEKIESMDVKDSFLLRSDPVPYGSSAAYIVMTGTNNEEGTGFRFVSFNSGALNGSGEFFIEIPEPADNISDIDAFVSFDGDYIICVKTIDDTYVKKVSAKGESMSKLVHIPELVDVIELGDILKGISTDTDTAAGKDLPGSTGEFTGAVWTFDLNGEPSKVLYRYNAYIAGGFFAVTDSKYCIAGFDIASENYYADVYDKNDAFVKRIEFSKDLPLSFCSDKETVTSVEIVFDDVTNEERFFLTKHDLQSGTVLQKYVDGEKLDEMYLTGTKLMPAGWGYVLYYRYLGKTDSAISKVLFLTDEMEIIGSMSLPGGAGCLPQSDRVVVVWEDEDGRSMAWTEVLFSDFKRDESKDSGIYGTGEDDKNDVNRNDQKATVVPGKTVPASALTEALTKPSATGKTTEAKAAVTGAGDHNKIWIIVAVGALSVAFITVLRYKSGKNNKQDR